MNKIITRSDMSARIAGYILILQSEKNHDSVERLNRLIASLKWKRQIIFIWT
ncbi:hypothetical protein NXW48_16500 [Phocaeicola vulgatus]|nr:hypothetical protein [Phocaeicola vulgatus]